MLSVFVKRSLNSVKCSVTSVIRAGHNVAAYKPSIRRATLDDFEAVVKLLPASEERLGSIYKDYNRFLVEQNYEGHVVEIRDEIVRLHDM